MWFYLIEGLNKMSPFANFGLFTEILKAMAPPMLIPHIKIFKFEYFVFIFIVNCSLTETSSSKDSSIPLLFPYDCPKFLKSKPAIMIPFAESYLANSPHIPVCPFKEWKKTTTARGFTFAGGYQKCIINLVPW